MAASVQSCMSMASTADRAANSTPRLRLDRAEFAGSLGDLGTFIPLLTPGAPNALHRLIREAIDQRNVPLDDVVKRWLTVSDCAGLLLNDVSGLDLNKGDCPGIETLVGRFLAAAANTGP